jgi:hypothetical protein
MMQKRQQDQSQIKWVADFIWNIADDEAGPAEEDANGDT